MPNDPGLAGDTCFYMEAVTGDGGTHDPRAHWWLSPDIQLTGPVSGPDNADPGQTNPVVVKFHRKVRQYRLQHSRRRDPYGPGFGWQSIVGHGAEQSSQLV